MRRLKKYFSAVVLSLCVFSAVPSSMAFAQQKTGVVLLVNGQAITNSDIAKREAFLKLQHQTGNLQQKAKQELIDETLRWQEIQKRKISIPDAAITKAYSGFASKNNLTVQQLNEIMNQTGVTPAHFQNYIRNQMAWGKLLSTRYQAEAMITQEEAIRRMQKNGGKKPSLNEYLLKQVILVAPKNRRSAVIGERMRDANAIRSKINGCDNLYDAAKGKLDVTVRTLGRFLEPQIPPEWENSVRHTSVGKPTKAQQTQRGVEFLVVCSVKKSTDDRVAQIVYSMQDNHKSAEKGLALERKYMQELHSAAKIENR